MGCETKSRKEKALSMKPNKKVDHGSGRKRILGISAAVLIAGVCAAASNSDSAAVSQKTALDQTGKQVSVKTTLGNLPLAFEPNRGQTSSQAKFLARGEGYSVLLTGNAAVLQLHGKDADNLVRMRFAGSNASPRVHGQEKQAFQTNYFLGADASKWFHVPNYGAVRYDAVYPGVDVLFHGNHRKLQYDFVVGAGADPSQIRLAFDGVSNASVNDRGELVLNAGGNQLRNLKPYIYQERNGVRQTVEGRYALKGSEVAFEIAKYDHSQALVIDPSVAFSTYVGGTLADDLRAVAVDSTGVYVAGSTTSSATADVALAAWPNASNTVPVVLAGSNLGLANALVAKLTLTGDGFSYISIFGGTGTEAINGIAVAAGEVYAVGTTSSPNFPQVGSLQTYQKSIPSVGATQDAFFSHLNAAGTAFVMSTYIGGGDNEQGNAVAVDSAGTAYVVGTTRSANLLYGVGTPFQATLNTNNIGGINTDGFVVGISSASAVVYNTYFGGTGDESANAAAVDSSGMLYIAGQTASNAFAGKFPVAPNTAAGAFIGLDNTLNGPSDAFVAKLNPAAATSAAQLVYSTYLGGFGVDKATGLAVDLAGQAYVTGTSSDPGGFTQSPFTFGPPFDAGTDNWQFGNTGAGQNVFVAKLNSTGSVLRTLITLGGTAATMTSTGIAVDSQEQVYLSGYVTGTTLATDVPAATGANANPPLGPAAGDQGFFARFIASGYMEYLTYTNSGAANSVKENGLALLDSTRDVYIAGTTTAAVATYVPVAVLSADTTFAGASEGFVFGLNFNDAINTSPIPATAAQLNWTLAQGVTGATLAQRSSKITITNSDTGFGTLAIPTLNFFQCSGVPGTVAVSIDNGTLAANAGKPGIGFKRNGLLGVDVTVILQTNPAVPTDFTNLTPGNYPCILYLNTPQTEFGFTTVLGNILITSGALTAVPPSLTFNQVTGGVLAGPQSVDIVVTPPAVGNAVDIPIVATIAFPAGTATWATITTTGNTAGVANVTVTPVPPANSLPPGIYTATVTVSPAAQVLPLSNAPVSFQVTLVVSNAGPPVFWQIGVFRSLGAPDAAPGTALAEWVLDRNGNYQFDLGVDTFHFFGLNGDVPVVGDWTGSGVVRMGVFRNGTWYLDLNNNGTWDGVDGGDAVYSFGLPGDIPVVGDWNGNGITKLGVVRCPAAPAVGVCSWILDVAGHNNFDGTAITLFYGLTGDVPVVGNWVGGAVRADQIGVFRCPAVGVCNWIVDSNGNGAYDATDAVYSFGLPGDQPVVGDWNQGGRKRIGVFRGGTWILDSNGNNAFDLTDLTVFFGLPGDIGVVGKWPVGGTLGPVM